MVHPLLLFGFGVLCNSWNEETWEFCLPTNVQAFARRNIATMTISVLNNSIFQVDDAVTLGFESQKGPHCELVEDYVLCFVFRGQWQMHKYDMYENNWKFIQIFEQVDAVKYLDGFLFVISGNHFKKCDVLSWRCTSLIIADIPENTKWSHSCPPVEQYDGELNEFSWLFYNTHLTNPYKSGFWIFNLKTNAIQKSRNSGIGYITWNQYQDCSKRIWRGSRMLPNLPIAKHYQDWELQKVISNLESSLKNVNDQHIEYASQTSHSSKILNFYMTKQSIEIAELARFVYIWNVVGLVVVCLLVWFVVASIIRQFIVSAHVCLVVEVIKTFL